MKVVYNTCFGGFSISYECATWMAHRGNQECLRLLKEADEDPDMEFYGSLSRTPRHDALLVMAVEHLGQERASGYCAELDVHELSGDRYVIREYDGAEHIEEPHNIDWVTV